MTHVPILSNPYTLHLKAIYGVLLLSLQLSFIFISSLAINAELPTAIDSELFIRHYPPQLRKSEVTDLKLQLRQLAGSRAPGTDDSKRDLFKKVISYMTIGIDVSSVFSEMVMCSATSDIVLKKMCYLYVGNYASNNPDLALLTINFLQRDCKDQDPMIRGLALRSLCTLRVANLVEYLVGPLVSGLKDGSSYVRTVAAIGVLKLYHISVVTCIDADFPAMLKHLMLNDPDSQVCF